MINSNYWNALISSVLHHLQQNGDEEAVMVIENGQREIEYIDHDNWNGGIDYYNINITLKYKDYMQIYNREKEVAQHILDAFNFFHRDESVVFSSIIIKPAVEQFINWKAIFPETKESLLKLIDDEIKLLMNVALFKISYLAEGVETKFNERHQKICELADKAKFHYPVQCDSLAEWWNYIKTVGDYSERKAYIDNLFTPLMNQLNETDETTNIEFGNIADKTITINKALTDARLFMSKGMYVSAVDRIHTALHGYVRELLTGYGVDLRSEDSLPSLFSKLCDYFGTSIQPPVVGEKIKRVLRSAGGIINAVNELRNNNTVAHPNDQLIQEREAQLVIALASDIVTYIEDVDKTISQRNH